MTASIAPTEAAEKAVTTADAIRLRLQRNSISKAAILDDAYDGITIASFSSSELEQFEGELADAQILADLKRVLPAYDESAEFDVDAARLLWDAKSKWSATLRPLAEKLFIKHQTQIDRLAKISSALKKVGLEVVELGVPKNEDIKALEGIPLVFLDYQLESEALWAAAQNKALAEGSTSTGKRKSVLIAQQLSKSKKRPFLVLISSLDLTDTQNAFRENAGYMRGTFGALRKDDAGTENLLFVQLYSWGVGHPALEAISEFISTLGQQASVVATDFAKGLLRLDVQDYSFIQRLSLSMDGEPLGEYCLNLLSESLGHRLRNDTDVMNARRELDGLHFTEHLSSAVQPSGTLARFYSEALTDRGAQPLEDHPLHHLQTPAPTIAIPRVMQGDIFYNKTSKQIYVVMNCGCDLQFSPVNKDRLPEPETTILFVEGTAFPYTQKPFSYPLRTEPFLIEDSPHRICWNPKRVKPMALGGLREWCKDYGFERIGKLRDIQAASIQQAWASQNARIGLPVPPPSFSAASYEIFIYEKDGGGKDVLSKIGECKGEVILSQHWSHTTTLTESFILTTNGLHALADVFARATVILKAEAAKNTTKKSMYLAQQAKAEAYATDLSGLFFLMEKEQPLPEKGKPKTLTQNVSIAVLSETEITADLKLSNLPNKPFLFLNIFTQNGALLAPVPAAAASRPAKEAEPTQCEAATAVQSPDQGATPGAGSAPTASA